MMISTNSFEDEDRKQARRAWRDAATISEIFELSARFIESRSPYFPGYGGDTVDYEAKDLVPYIAAFNRAGFLATVSQPGVDDPDWKQRAFVDGFALEPVAKRIARVSLYTELHIVVSPPDYPVGSHTPATLRGFMPHGWSRFTTFDELEFLEEACGEAAHQELKSAWGVSIVDLKWGRNDFFWPYIAQAICYSEKPHPDLELGIDFAI